LRMASATRVPSERSTPPSAPGSKGLSGSCVLLHPRPRCPPVRRSCGLGPRPRPCARPARSWRCVRTMCSKWSASLRIRVAFSTRGFHFNRFRGKRHRVRQVTGARTPGRLSRCYRCDNVTIDRKTCATDPRRLCKSAGSRSGVGHTLGRSGRGHSAYAPKKRRGRGHKTRAPRAM
jgi:hypothetical protein